MPPRGRGTGHLYDKHGSYYGRWRTLDGRNLNRIIGPVRTPGTSDGLTRAQAERAFRRLQDAEERAPRPARGATVPSVDEIGDALRQKLRLRGARRSYLEGCESMQRVHISPRLGAKPVSEIRTAHIEAVASSMLDAGLAPKTVRNVLTFLHSIFELALERHLIHENPVRHATRPGRRRGGDVNPDLQFLTVDQLDAVIRAVPDDVVIRTPAPTRRGREGPAPPPPRDVLGPVLRVLILAAAITGLRQSELLGLRWRDVDWTAQRIRVRNTFVRGEHSSDGKSELSTRRSVPMADRLARELDGWSQRTVYCGEDDLVFAHPQTGNPLDRSKVTKRFKAACSAAGVRPVRFHDLRHTFGTRLAATGQPIRSIQEFLGHADAKTTQIYTHYAPSEREVEMVNHAFELGATGNETGNELSETRRDSKAESPANEGLGD
jgi:integrase